MESGSPVTDIGPLQRLLLAYTPAALRDWQRLCWQLDQRLAAVVQRGGDPTIAAIRLAWWDEVLVEEDHAKGRGEPLVEQWRAIAPAGAGAAAGRLIDGWRLLLSPEPLSEDDLRDYGLARGGGLFGLIAGEMGEALNRAGAMWALWDLAAHVRDDEVARQALAVARMLADGARAGPNGYGDRQVTKPLRLAYAVTCPDVLAGAIPPAGFSLRHYGRLLWASLRD